MNPLRYVDIRNYLKQQDSKVDGQINEAPLLNSTSARQHPLPDKIYLYYRCSLCDGLLALGLGGYYTVITIEKRQVKSIGTKARQV